MKRLFLLTAILGLSAQDLTLRVDVRLVRVAATVKDNSGQPVGALRKEDFRVWDSGMPQEIAVFERSTAQPLSVAVLIDASGSTAKDLPAGIGSVRRFLKALMGSGNSDDSASLYSFNYEVVQVTPFTRSASRLDRGLSRLKGEAGTSLYDAIKFAAADLEKRKGTKVMVIVTDGGDTTSGNTFRDAMKSAQLADAILYPVIVIPIQNDAGRNTGGENALSSLAHGTGGRIFHVSLGAALDKAFSDVLSDLRTQYLLGYYPRNVTRESGPFHELRIQVLDQGEESTRLRVFARNGYYEESMLSNRAR